MQIRKDIENLYNIQQRLMSFCVNHNVNTACVDDAYKGLGQVIKGLEKLEDSFDPDDRTEETEA